MRPNLFKITIGPNLFFFPHSTRISSSLPISLYFSLPSPSISRHHVWNFSQPVAPPTPPATAVDSYSASSHRRHCGLHRVVAASRHHRLHRAVGCCSPLLRLSVDVQPISPSISGALSLVDKLNSSSQIFRRSDSPPSVVTVAAEVTQPLRFTLMLPLVAVDAVSQPPDSPTSGTCRRQVIQARRLRSSVITRLLAQADLFGSHRFSSLQPRNNSEQPRNSLLQRVAGKTLGSLPLTISSQLCGRKKIRQNGC